MRRVLRRRWSFANQALEAEVRKLVITLIAALVVSGTAYGQSKSSTAPEKKQSKTRALPDNQMDRVTAAGEEQEALAANNSTITETNSGAVNLSGSALMGAKGVNIVNETDALVGNGVNVYNGSTTAVTIPIFNGTVHQDNTIDQSSRTEATLKNYKRGANSQLSVTSSSDDTESSSSLSTKATTFSHTLNDSDIDTNSKITTSASTSNQSETKTSSSSHSTTLNTTDATSNTANSTDTDASTSTKGTTSNDTASSNSTNATSSSTGSGSSSSSGGSSSHSNSGSGGGATSTTSGGQSNALATTGTGSASNHTQGSSSTDADTTTNNSTSNSSDTSASTKSTNDTKATTDSTTANNSDTTSKSSTANNSSTTTSSDTDTHATSTNSTLNTSDTKSSSKHVVKSYHKTNNVQGAVSFDSASAQNIAVDGSKIDATNTYSVTLAGTAEQNATALNIVNAAGGMVANGVNVARTSNLIGTPMLTQTNTISQTR